MSRMTFKQFFHLRSLRKQLRAAQTRMRVVWNMRRDVLSPDEATDFRAAADTLTSLRRSRDADAIESALAEADSAVLAAAPPRPLPGLRELVETLVVAFGVAMTFRAYFFQPFKIPTGSMQPTLFGHHSEFCDTPAWYDAMPFKPFAWLVTGRWYTEVVAPASGSLAVYTDRNRAPGYIFVNAAGQDFRIPQDAYERHELTIASFPDAGMADAGGGRTIVTRGMVRAGDRIWSGYSIAGDHVFVNRFKWYFRPPRRGEIVVFSTDGNPHLAQGEFYIKRLTGLPGEEITIDPPFLVADGQRVTEPDPILRVAERRPAATPGYTYLGYAFVGSPVFGSLGTGRPAKPLLGLEGDTARLGPDEYLPMGDNTANSYDGRFWGPVKATRLIGNASCVYWPISRRWGNVD